jgi:DNA-binding FadR family transcriptional regulator
MGFWYEIGRIGSMTGFQGQPGSERARELAERILAGFADGGPAVGGRLPTERQLASELGVTRTAVRHALGLLEARGVVSREVGRGTFLLDGRPQEEAPSGPATS